MSHVVDMELEVKDLEALAKACSALGLEFVENQKTHRWFGRWMNDYAAADAAYKAGIAPQDYGKCDHAIRVKGNPQAYEIGVVRRKDGRPGYQLIWDFYGGGFGLEDKIGSDGGLLKQRYAAEVTKKQLLREGYRIEGITFNKQGKMLLTFTE